ncbi:MAG: hypothetical protein NVS1B14_02510 [Vulcanimicrobiaceae bacterium]
MNVRAVILAAGKGTRMKSARPKVLHDVCGKPMLWYTVHALRQAGVTEVVVVGNSELDPELPQFGVRSIVQEPQLGTGHALQVAMRELPAMPGRVLVAYGDMPLVGAQIFSALLAFGAESAAAAVMVTARMPLPSNFGRVIRAGETVRRIIEERDCSAAEKAVDEMNAGIYAYDEPSLREVLAGCQPEAPGRLSSERRPLCLDLARAQCIATATRCGFFIAFVMLRDIGILRPRGAEARVHGAFGL